MRSRVLGAVFAALALVSCNSDDDSSAPTSTVPDFVTTSSVPTTPVVARVLSPEPGSVQGSGGRGMVVVLTFTATDPTVLPAELRLPGAPAAPAALRPGHNPAFPALVVTLSTTGSALGGPTANLANLFSIVSPAPQADGSTRVSAVWSNTSTDFGSDVDATLEAFTVSGTAPDILPTPPANLDLISNRAEVTFRVSGAGGTPAVGGATTTTRRTTTTRATTATTRATTGTTRAGNTTVAPSNTTTTTRPSTTTTTVPATTSTT